MQAMSNACSRSTNRLTVCGDEGGSQRLVARHEAIERAAQQALVQFAHEPHVQRDMVGFADVVRSAPATTAAAAQA